MIKHYFKTGLRQLQRHKFFSLLTILGLGISMSVCLLIIMLLRDAHSFDRFHPESERVYRLLTVAQRKGGGVEPYASSPYPVGRVLAEDYNYIEEWAPLVREIGGEVEVEGKNLMLRGLFTTPDFLDLFGFRLDAGNAATALSQPYQIVLTAETAERFFGDSNPVGKVVTLPAYGDFQVSGVFGPFAGKTHLEFEALASFATIPGLEQREAVSSLRDNWNNYYTTYNYFRLKEGVAPEEAEAALEQIARTRYADLELESRDAGYNFRLQALGDITPGPMFSNNMGRAVPSMLLWFFSALGVVVVVLACFNYANLTIARTLVRTREIGVRKVVGALRPQIVGQLLFEAVLTAFLSLGLAYLLLQFIVSGFNRLSFAAQFDITLREDALVLGCFLVFAAAVGLLAGALPAAVLSRANPLAMFQKFENARLFRRVGLRKVFIVLQFAVSLVFLILIATVYQQMRFTLAMDYGFDREQLVNVRLQGQPYQKVVDEIARLPGVEKVSAMSHNLGTWEDSSVDVRRQETDEPRSVRDFAVDHELIDNLGLTLLAGRDFEKQESAASYVIVNERFLEEFQLGDPASAVGRPLLIGDSTRVTVGGVVEDFLFRPVSYAIGPLLLRYDPESLNILNVRLGGGDPAAAISGLESAWKRIDPARPLDYRFYDEIIRDNYTDFRDMLWMVGFIAFLSITIACLGLLGIAAYTVETRRREVSVRKVFGASWADLALLLSRGFLALIGVAVLVAVPVGYYLSDQILQDLAYRIEMSAWLFVLPVALIGLVAGLAIGSQTLRAAAANPVDNLRYE